MKKCSDCKWCEWPSKALRGMETEYWCKHPTLLGETNTITGHTARRNCYEERKYGKICGKDGNLWVMKGRYLQRFLSWVKWG